MPEKTKKRIKKDTNKELVDFVIKELPNLYDSVPRADASRTAVEKFLKELCKKC